ncbi:hypothetical protein V5O48_008963 [Marasmius crinis-equi]|uniref:Uncharacterized protein n=1 Tax=Marasmius crinis-equi TaxID=585013 RepID=A0ABR3FCF2_9AGAR
MTTHSDTQPRDAAQTDNHLVPTDWQMGGKSSQSPRSLLSRSSSSRSSSTSSSGSSTSSRKSSHKSPKLPDSLAPSEIRRRKAWRTKGWGYPWRYNRQNAPISHFARGDYRELGLSWRGRPGRDESLDGLANREWAQAQMYRISPQAQDDGAPPPTFTGEQIISRLQQVSAELQRAEEREAELERERIALNRRVAELAVVQEDLKDLQTLACTWFQEPFDVSTS